MSTLASSTQALPTRRWTLFADPVVPGKAKGPRNRAPTKNIHAGSTNTSGKSRGGKSAKSVGKLKHLLNMPLEIVFEITSQLHPLDLLYLSRVNKAFRALFVSRHWKPAWTVSLGNVEGLPACPQDITEPDYARLLWENECYVCGAARANKAEYSLRMRFCGPCHYANVKKGAYIASLQFGRKSPMPDFLYTLLPRALGEYWSPTDPIPDDMTERNITRSFFYIPEFNQISRRFVQLSDSSTPKELLEAFTNGQKQLSNRIMRHTAEVLQWERAYIEIKRQANDENSSQRRWDIENRLLGLGWQRSEFHSHGDMSDRETIDQWDQLLNQPRLLTDRIWRTILPKLEELREAKRLRALEIEQDDRRVKRRSEIEVLMPAFLKKWVHSEEDRITMPNSLDIAQIPEVEALVNENNVWTEMTAARLDTVAKDILFHAIIHRMNVRRDLVAILYQDQTYDSLKLESLLDDNDWVFRQLSQAASFFVTKKRCTRLQIYPKILQDPEVRDVPWHKAKEIISNRARISNQWGGHILSVDIYAIVKVVLCRADMSSQASRGDVANKQFTCNCGHGDYRYGVSFAVMVEHALTEIVKYEMAQRNGRSSWPVAYLNDHPLKNLSSQIWLKQHWFDSTSLGSTASNPSRLSGYCVHCYGISYGQVGQRLAADEVSAHMSSKHGVATVTETLLGDSLTDLQAKHDAVFPGVGNVFGTRHWDCW